MISCSHGFDPSERLNPRATSLYFSFWPQSAWHESTRDIFCFFFGFSHPLLYVLRRDLLQLIRIAGLHQLPPFSGIHSSMSLPETCCFLVFRVRRWHVHPLVVLSCDHPVIRLLVVGPDRRAVLFENAFQSAARTHREIYILQFHGYGSAENSTPL